MQKETSSHISQDKSSRKNFAQEINQDLQLVQELQRECFFTLGQNPEQQMRKIRSFDIANIRFNYEKHILYPPISQEEKMQRTYRFREDIYDQMVTNLKERDRVYTSEYKINIKDNKLYSEYSEEEPLEKIYWRGVMARRKIGSSESEREEKEFDGFLSLQKYFTDKKTSVGTRYVIFSPPGTKKDTPYTQNFVDIYEVREDDEKKNRYIHAVRYTSPLSIEEYKKKALEIDPAYDNTRLYMPMDDDAWFLSHPIKIPETHKKDSTETILTELFEKEKDTMDDRTFQQKIMTDDMTLLIDAFTNTILEKTRDWKKAAKYFDLYLKYNDSMVQAWKSQSKDQTFENSYSTVVFQRPMHQEHRQENDQRLDMLTRVYKDAKIENISAGCGLSAGYEQGTAFSVAKPIISEQLKNSVAQFGLDYKDDPNLCRCGGREPHFHCPGKDGMCNNAIIVGQGITVCKCCGQGKTC